MNNQIHHIDFLLERAGVGQETVYAAQEALESYRAIEALELLSDTKEERGVFLQTIEHAVERLTLWPYDGKLYKDILIETYFVPEVLSEAERLEKLALSRSDYYRKKREACKLFAIALYRGSIYF